MSTRLQQIKIANIIVGVNSAGRLVAVIALRAVAAPECAGVQLARAPLLPPAVTGGAHVVAQKPPMRNHLATTAPGIQRNCS